MSIYDKLKNIRESKYINEAMKLDKVNHVHAHGRDAEEFAKHYVKGHKGDYNPGGPTEKHEKDSENFHNTYKRIGGRNGFGGSGHDIYQHTKTGEKFRVDRHSNGKGFYGTDHMVSKLHEETDLEEGFGAAVKKAEASRQRAIKKAAAWMKRTGKSAEDAAKEHDLFASDVAHIKKHAGMNEEAELDEESPSLSNAYMAKLKIDYHGKDKLSKLETQKMHKILGTHTVKNLKHIASAGIDNISQAAKLRVQKHFEPSFQKESTELDEISQAALRNYHAAAGADRKAARQVVSATMDKTEPSEGELNAAAKAYKRFGKRGKGMTLAAKKMDENYTLGAGNPYHGLHPDVVKRKIKASQAQIADLQAKSMRTNFGSGGDRNAYAKEIDQHRNRINQLKAAKTGDKMHVKEDLDLEENTMPGNVALRLVDRHQAAAFHHKKNGNYKGYAAHMDVAGKIEDAVIRAGRDMPIRSARLEATSDKAFKAHPHRVAAREEAEQIDELKKSTLASYVKKASQSAADAGHELGKKRADYDDVMRFTNRNGMKDKDKLRDTMVKSMGADFDSQNKTRQKAAKRLHGIERATDRLAKEEVELDESIQDHELLLRKVPGRFDPEQHEYHMRHTDSKVLGTLRKGSDAAKKHLAGAYRDGNSIVHKKGHTIARIRSTTTMGDLHAQVKSYIEKNHPVKEEVDYVSEHAVGTKVKIKGTNSSMDGYKGTVTWKNDAGTHAEVKLSDGDTHSFHVKHLVKEEVELDEVSKKTLVNYMDKSKKETGTLQKKYNAGKLSKDDEGRYDRRVRGQITAMNKFHGRAKVAAGGVDKAYDAAQRALRKEETEQIDELKRTTLKSYINKATDDKSKHNDGIRNATSDAAHDYHKGEYNKRKAGLAMAYKKAMEKAKGRKD